MALIMMRRKMRTQNAFLPHWGNALNTKSEFSLHVKKARQQGGE